jgi:hypothetical protein
MPSVEVLVETVARSRSELDGRTFAATSCFGNIIRRDDCLADWRGAAEPGAITSTGVPLRRMSLSAIASCQHATTSSTLLLRGCL